MKKRGKRKVRGSDNSEKKIKRKIKIKKIEEKKVSKKEPILNRENIKRGFEEAIRKESDRDIVNQEVVRYLSDCLRLGFGIEILKNKLLEKGHLEADVNIAIDYVTKKLRDEREKEEEIEEEYGERLGILEKISDSIVAPKELFENTKREKIIFTLLYQLIILLIPAIIMSILIYAILPILLEVINGIIPNILELMIILSPFSLKYLTIKNFIIASCIFIFIIIPLFTFLFAGIIHLFVKLGNGDGRYKETYKAIVYSSTPSFLFFFLLFPFIWSFVLQVIGISIYHNMSKFKAFCILLMPLLIFVLIIIGLIIFII
jgi:hypothetical protein